MAICIIIKKILEKNNVGYYEISTKISNEADFYIGINKKTQKIYCYLTNDFTKPIRIIECNNPNERVGSIPEINIGPDILGRVILKAMKTFILDEFPNDISYQA